MKKTFLFLAFCMTIVLAGCGKDEPVEDSQPLEIQKATDSTTESNDKKVDVYNEGVNSENSESEETVIHITTAPEYETVTLSTKTGAVSFVTRDKNSNIDSSHGTVTVPAVVNPVTKSTTKLTTAATNIKTATKTTKATTSTTTASTSSSTTTNTTTEEQPNHVPLTFSILENGIVIEKEGEVVQFIEADTAELIEYKDNPLAVVTAMDYDFDGYDDLYIPYAVGTLNTNGIFIHYNPESEMFELWEEMNEKISHYTWIEDKELHTVERNSAVEHLAWVYVWDEENKLQLKNYSVQYENEDGIFIDYFEYPNDEETLVKREKLIYDEENNVTYYEDVPLDSEDTTKPTEPAEETEN